MLLLNDNAGRLSVTATINQYDNAYLKNFFRPAVSQFYGLLISARDEQEALMANPYLKQPP